MTTCLNCGHEGAAGFAFCPRCGTRVVEGAPGSDPLLGRTLNAKYRIEEKIGAGAMGTVYLGEHIGLKKKVALKILHPDLQVGEEALHRFQREGIAAGKFNHPHAIQIFDFDRGEGQLFYLAMEFVDGVNLAQFLERRGKLPCEMALMLARQLLSCLAEAHRHGIVHRDLKPDNVMIIEDARGELRLKVLDFGLSKLVHRRAGSSLMTQPGRLLGTPLYMAPEQIAGEEADARSDVYAAGLIVYEMIAGARPWHGEELGDVFMTRARREAPSIAADHPELHLPAELDTLLLVALTRDRRERFSAEAMLAALEDVPVEMDLSKAHRSRGARASVTVGPAAAARDAKSRGNSTTEVAAPPPRRLSRPLIAAGLLALVVLVAGGFVWFGKGVGARPSRVRMIAPDDRSDVERRYVQLLDESRAALRSRDTARAMSTVDQALALPCSDPEAIYVRAETYSARDEADMALADYRAASAADPAFAEPRLAMGWLLFDRGEIEAAERSFADADKIAPESGGALAARGALAWRKGALDEARASFERAIAVDPASGRAHLYLGRLRLDAGDVEGAIAALVEAKRNDPRSWQAVAWLGEAYLARQRYDEADAQLREALLLEPDALAVRELRAALLLERGRAGEALDFSKDSVERHPEAGRLWILRGVALSSNGDVDLAIDALKRGIDLGAGDSAARSLLGVLYQRDGKLDLALAEYDAVLSDTEQDHPEVELDYALALFAQAKHAEAARRFERVLEFKEATPAAHFHLGLLYMDYLGDPTKAALHLRRYVELGGTDARVKGWLARLP